MQIKNIYKQQEIKGSNLENNRHQNVPTRKFEWLLNFPCSRFTNLIWRILPFNFLDSLQFSNKLSNAPEESHSENESLSEWLTQTG